MLPRVRSTLQAIGCALAIGGATPVLATWDLDSQFPSKESWETARLRVQADVRAAAAYQGRIAEGPATLARAMDAASSARGLAARMARFGLLREVVDTQDPLARTQAAAGAMLETDVDSALAFLADEIAALGARKVESWIAREPRLGPHAPRLRELLHEGGLGPPGTARAVLAEMARAQRLTADVYTSLIEGDLGWLGIKAADGTTLRADPAAYRRLRRDRDRDLARRASTGLLERLAAHRATFATLLNGRVENASATARLRGFTNPMDHEFAQRDALPAGTWRVGATVARQRLPVLRRYLELRGRLMGISDHGYEALFVPPPGAQTGIAFDRALALAVEAGRPLGSDYVSRLREYMALRAMHAMPAANKRSTFGVFWQAGGGTPYLVMNYDGSLRSARTLASGLMLAVSYASIPAERTPVTRADPAVYSNAVIYASDFLFTRAYRAATEDVRARLAATVELVDRMVQHAFHYALVAEFDDAVAQRHWSGKPMTADEVSGTFLGLLREYYGEAAVAARLADLWIFALPNEFASYEHLAWMPAMAAGARIAQRALRGEPGASDAVIAAFKRSPTCYSQHLFAELGIDVADPGIYHELIDLIAAELDALEPQLPR